MSAMAKTTQPRRRRLEFDDEFKMAAVRLVVPSIYSSARTEFD